jgi:hypothetical protein
MYINLCSIYLRPKNRARSSGLESDIRFELVSSNNFNFRRYLSNFRTLSFHPYSLATVDAQNTLVNTLLFIIYEIQMWTPNTWTWNIGNKIDCGSIESPEYWKNDIFTYSKSCPASLPSRVPQKESSGSVCRELKLSAQAREATAPPPPTAPTKSAHVCNCISDRLATCKLNVEAWGGSTNIMAFW